MAHVHCDRCYRELELDDEGSYPTIGQLRPAPVAGGIGWLPLQVPLCAGCRSEIETQARASRLVVPGMTNVTRPQ